MMLARRISLFCAMVMSCLGPASADQLKDLSRLCGDEFEKYQSDPSIDSYFGSWDGKLPHLLAIVETAGTKVLAYYSTGVYAPWGITAGNCSKVEGTIAGDRIDFSLLGVKAKVVYYVKGIDLTGTYSRGGVDTPGSFKKVPLK